MEFVVNGPIPEDFMTNTENRLKPFRFDEEKTELFVLDQLLLPHKFEYVPVKNTRDAFSVIRKMQVRGAPLIAIVGALGLLVETCAGVVTRLRVLRAILKLLHDEAEENRRLIRNLTTSDSKFILMTICNTGSLATSSWGTALGVIYALHQEDLVEMVYVLETRPYNQGVRLTATEFLHAKVPFKVITDSMAAWAMKSHRIDAILVGADQVTLNGDVTNKIGTYMLGLLAKYHDVPFYAVVPVTSINLMRQSGDQITIEERPAEEMLSVGGFYVGNMNTPVWNPAFDVTPAELITKIITDRGNFAPKCLKLANLT
ncbi:unnamed protein product [Angiostrongylus costaricensis]|uniref:S-methyl-5-thioribose-1-phosphate isomerase n=1 Tax=Angiostrongylus costaricensis TaxID=334426 RepID=A0A0R3PW64_ANGCS|nr:unnamed protein product [Angiostrongylus costaricensis]